jgi:hypothetical protein
MINRRATEAALPPRHAAIFFARPKLRLMAFEAGFPTNLIHWLPPLRDIETDQEIESNDAKEKASKPLSAPKSKGMIRQSWKMAEIVTVSGNDIGLFPVGNS